MIAFNFKIFCSVALPNTKSSFFPPYYAALLIGDVSGAAYLSHLQGVKQSKKNHLELLE
jgi:hypothetical protein